ncbi:hypothetical protein RTP6_000768 [Batrachochytrium dendrobatidis]
MKSQDNAKDRSSSISRICALTDRLLNSDLSGTPAAYSRRINTANQLLKFLLTCPTNIDVQPAIAVLINGGRGLQPIEVIFDEQHAPDAFKILIVECIAAAVTTIRGNPAIFFRWLFERINALDRTNESFNWLMQSLKETIRPRTDRIGNYGFGNSTVIGIISNLLLLTRDMDPSISFFPVIENLKVIANEYPDIFTSQFPVIVATFIEQSAVESLTKPTLDKVWDAIISFWPFWTSHIAFGLVQIHHQSSLIDQGLANLWHVQSSGLEFQNAYSLVVELECAHAILYSLYMASFQSINPQLETLLSTADGNYFDMLEATKHLLYQIQLLNDAIQDCRLTTTSLQVISLFQACSELCQAEQLVICQDLIMLLGGKYLERATLSSGYDDVLAWMNCSIEVLSASSDPIIDPYFIDMCLYPSNSVVLSHVRIGCVGSLSSMEILSDFILVVLERLRLSHAVSQPVSFSSPGEVLVETFHIMRYMIQDFNGMENLNEPRLVVNMNDLPYPQPAFIAGMDYQVLRRLFQLNLSICSASINSGVPGYHSSTVFVWLYDIWSMASSTAHFSMQLWWDTMDLNMIIILTNLAASNNYFLPALMISSEQIKAVPFWPCIDRLFQFIRNVFDLNVYDRQIIAMHTIHSIISDISTKNKIDTDVSQSGVLQLVESTLVYFLDSAATQFDPFIRVAIADMWEAYLVPFKSNRRGYINTASILTKFKDRLDDIDKDVRNAYWKVIRLFDPIDTQMCLSSLEELSQNCSEHIQSFKLAVMASPTFVTFKPRHFQLFLAYMGTSQCFQPAEEDAFSEIGLGMQTNEWLIRMFHTSQALQVLRSNTNPPSEDMLAAASLSQTAHIFWAQWECARFCVLSKLKTPIGGPLQTLDVFDRTLHLYQSTLNEMKETTSIGSIQLFAVVQRLRHFLEFLDIFEIQIFNASRGNFSILPLVSKGSMAFLHTNRRVCDEWYARIRMLVVELSHQIEADSITIRHGYKALRDRVSYLKLRTVKEISVWETACAFLLVAISSALRRSKDADGLIGLAQYWRRETQNIQPPITITGENIYKWICIQAILAEGKYEMALDELHSLAQNLTDTEKSVIKVDLHSLMRECYFELGDWKSACHLLKIQSNTDLKHDTDRIFRSDGIGADDMMLSNLSEFVDPDTFESSDKSISTFLHHGFGVLTEKIHLDTAIGLFSKTVNHSDIIQQASDLYQSIYPIVTINESDRAIVLLVFYQVLNHIAGDGHTAEITGAVRFGGARAKDRIHPESISSKHLGNWIKLHMQMKENESFQRTRKRDPDLDEIRGILANLARKACNFGLANRLLDSSQSNLTASGAMQNNFKLARLLFEEGRSKDATSLLLNVINTPNSMLDPSDFEIKAKSCILISKWNRSVRLDISDSQIKRNLDLILPHSSAPVPMSEYWLSHNLLKRATELSPDYPKSWFAFGTFCYRVGRRALDSLSSREVQSNLIQDDLQQLHTYLDEIGHEDIFGVVIASLLGDFGESLRDHAEQDWRAKIRSSCEDYDLHISYILQVLDVIRGKIFEYFNTAVSCYFKYLHVHHHSKAVKFTFDQSATHDGKKESKRLGDTITTTLRLIRLFTKFGAAFYQTFTKGFVSTPTSQWETVIPQLFSRLHHPEPIVRQEIANLLCHIGTSSPQLIMYPVILGSKPETQRSELALIGYTKVLSILRTNNAELVSLVTAWVDELQKITVFWEELWLIGLERVQSEVQGRVERLIIDIRRINSNKSLSNISRMEVMKRNATSVMKPILFAMDKLNEQTVANGATTRHEQRFIEHFGEIIENSLKVLRETAKFEDPKILLNSFKEIHTQLIKYVRKNQSIQLADVSPYLAGISGSLISIPGLMDENGALTIAGCEHDLLIIPTKTKPKKIKFIASNGRSYSYLLKGLEDLHLDERIQQFILAVNYLLKGDRLTRSRNLSARSFAVVPLGDNFGMIQWIEDAVGLFSIYRKWQQREHLVKTLQHKEGTPEIPPPMRPHDIFAAKAAKALSAHGIKEGTPRKNWPIEVLRDVFTELERETPSDLIAKELWSSSDSSLAWWQKTKGLARSAAVMSIVGYVIGLGDRHLDNILIDVGHGELAHIDFNVCFEKGRSLRIPETVPFRLTQNLVGALGPTGTDGLFRIACEQVFRVMRNNREILLTLLEAFIYDPLVDWTHNTKSQHEKSLMNLNALTGIMSSRIIEMKGLLMDNFQKLDDSLDLLVKQIDLMAAVISDGSNLVCDVSIPEQNQSEASEAREVPDAIANQFTDAKNLLDRLYHNYSDYHAKHVHILSGLEDFILHTGPQLKSLLDGFAVNDMYTPSTSLPVSGKMHESYQQLNQNLSSCITNSLSLHSDTMANLKHYRTLLASHSSLILQQDSARDWSLNLKKLIDSDFALPTCMNLAQHLPNLDTEKSMSVNIFAMKMFKSLDDRQIRLKSLKPYCDRVFSNDAVSTVLNSTIQIVFDCNTHSRQLLVDVAGVMVLSETVRILFDRTGDGLLFSFDNELSNLKEFIEPALSEIPLTTEDLDTILITPTIECILSGLKDLGKTVGFMPCGVDQIDLSLLNHIATTARTVWLFLESLTQNIICSALKSIVLCASGIDALIGFAAQLDELSLTEICNSTCDKIKNTKLQQMHNIMSELEAVAFEHGGLVNQCFEQLQLFLKYMRDTLAAPISALIPLQSFSDLITLHVISLFSVSISCSVAYSSSIQFEVDDPTAESLDIDGIANILRKNSEFKPFLAKQHIFEQFVIREVISNPTETLINSMMGAFLKKYSTIDVSKPLESRQFLDDTGLESVDRVRRLVNFQLAHDDIELKQINMVATHIVCFGFAKVRQNMIFWTREIADEQSNQLQKARSAFERYTFFHSRALKSSHHTEASFSSNEIFEKLQNNLIQLTTEKSVLEDIRIQAMNMDQEIISMPHIWNNPPAGNLSLDDFAIQSQNRGKFLSQLQSQQKMFWKMCEGITHFESFRTPTDTCKSNEHAATQAVRHIAKLADEILLIRKYGHCKSQLRSEKIDIERKIMCDLGVDATLQFKAVLKNIDPILRITPQILKLGNMIPQSASLVTIIKNLHKTWHSLSEKPSKLTSACQADPSVELDVELMRVTAKDFKENAQLVFDGLFSLVEIPEFTLDMDTLDTPSINTLKISSPMGEAGDGAIAEIDAAVLGFQAASLMLDQETIEAAPLSQEFADEQIELQTEFQQQPGTFRFNREQARNAYAVNVLKKIRLKLEGRESDFKSRLSVPDHVEQIIKEATNKDNLASMYEGWMSWI